MRHPLLGAKGIYPELASERWHRTEFREKTVLEFIASSDVQEVGGPH